MGRAAEPSASLKVGDNKMAARTARGINAAKVARAADLTKKASIAGAPRAASTVKGSE